METTRLGRNDLCRCGSGKKFKKCCLLSSRDDRPRPLFGHQLNAAQPPTPPQPPAPAPKPVPPGTITEGTERVIEGTAEHPFYVYGKGWTPMGALQPGDWLRTDNGWVEVGEVGDTGRVETVYNLKVADHHTYFVGSPEWGFGVWAHNADYAVLPHPSGKGFALAELQPNGTYRWVTEAGVPNPTQPRLFATAADADAAIASGGGTRLAGTPTSNPILPGPMEMPVLQTPAGHQAPQLGGRLGQGGEGAVFQHATDPGWAVKVYKQGTNPLEARNMINRLDQARAIPGRADNVVRTRPLVDPANPRGQNWVVREEVLPTNVPPDYAQQAQVLRDFLPTHPDAAGNLLWGTTAGNSTPRWILIE
jgi:hypothetical protein